MTELLQEIFVELRARMVRSSAGMRVSTDDPGNLIIKTTWDEPGKKEPAWFGAVQLKKNYISYHLMPLYALPALREAVPPALQKHMQGKSCFNFKKLEAELFDALEAFTVECAACYAAPLSATPH